jgi:serine/threonine protein kinase
MSELIVERSVRAEGGEVRVLSRGEIADVLEVRRGSERVIVKVLREGAGEVERCRFEGEVAALAAVRHVNVVRTLRVIHDDEGPRALVMPRLVGRSIREWLTTLGPLPAPLAACVFGDALSGLGALHRRALVHRDVKPDNLFLGREEHEPPSAVRCIVLDLGLAASPLASLTTGRHVVGSVGYLAPEQVLAGNLDARTDVWGAGVSLFEAVSRRPAFLSDDPLCVLERDPFDDLTQREARALRPFEPLLRRALAKRPALRWPSAAAMGEALAGVSA